MGAEISVLNRLPEAQAVEETGLKASSSETELGKSEVLVGEVREAAKIVGKVTTMASRRKRKSVWDEGDGSECVRGLIGCMSVFVSSFMFP